MSRPPVTDPNHVPFTYVTEAVSYTVRDGGLVELAFAAEHLADPGADEPPPRVVEARLAMPLVTAANLAEVLGRITMPLATETADPPSADPAVSHAITVAGLDFVVRELLDHSVDPSAREDMLDWLRDKLHRELQKAAIEGVDVAGEGPAVDHAIGVLEQMFERWSVGPEPST